jgi:hypothetical protein
LARFDKEDEQVADYKVPVGGSENLAAINGSADPKRGERVISGEKNRRELDSMKVGDSKR